MAKIRLKLVKRAVNSKTLAARIEAFVTEAINDILGDANGNWSGRDWFVELTNAFLFDLAEEGRIVQWDVICDARNNKMSDLDAGRLHVDISFKQYDCVNTTRFSYTLSNTTSTTDETSDCDMFG